MSFAQYNPSIQNDTEEEEEDDYNYILFHSSRKCPHSKKLIKLLNESDIDPTVQSRIVIMDIIERYKNRLEIPDYIKFVPALIISDPLRDEVEAILYGDEIRAWAQKHKRKQSFTTVDGGCNFAPRNCYSRHNFGLNIEVDKFGKPVDQDPTQFQIATDQNRKKDIQDDYQKFQEEYNKQNEEFGIQGGASYGTTIDDKPKRKGRGKKKNGISSFQGGGGLGGKGSSGKYASYMG